MEFLKIPLFDEDFFKMLFRFTLNIIFLTLIIKRLYYKNSNKKEFVFTYYMIGIIVFFLCFTLKKYELDVGMALGLFAIFGIIRYRTDAIAIKEMTYLFVIIGVSVINSLANKKMSLSEILAANILVIISLYLLEKMWIEKLEASKTVTYEKIENIKPQNHVLLVADLEERTGIKINRIKIGAIDFSKKSAKVTYYYNKQQG